MISMMSLTTIQRDLLYQLLAATAPCSAAVLGQHLHLTSRQVQYGLREIKPWLDRRQVTLRHTSGIGVEVVASPEQKQALLAEIAAHTRFQLILTAEQRQQLLALQLLAAYEPCILNQFQQSLAVSRATVLKDLEALESWLHPFNISIARRQHRGFWIEGAELARRQALAALLWGDVPVEHPIMAVHEGRIVFTLAPDAALLPIVGEINELVRAWDLSAAHHSITRFETELGGRFTDEAVVQLTLALAIQLQRIAVGQHVMWSAETLSWAQRQAIWPTAARIGAQMWPVLREAEHVAETAALVIQLIAQARDESWRNIPDTPALFHGLTDMLLERIARAYARPAFTQDSLLRDGLEAHILPACARQQFGLWSPRKDAPEIQTERYRVERDVATQLAAEIDAAIGVALPADAYNDLVLLLRAALVRARPEQTRRVLVVCPSGMATTQLLVARLKARFPRLGTLEVLPTRSLTAERVADADLIISTVPLTLPADLAIAVIQVHPLLKAEDVAALTQWMA